MTSPFKFALLVSASILPASAQADDAGGGRVDAIIVTANREARPQSETGQSVSVIDRAAMERRQSLAVADLLGQVPGVSISRNGGIGGVTTISIRGAESDQTVVLIDGVKLNDPASPGGGFNFGNLLAGGIERIEVVRGSQSVLWGSQAIGGVVNMITARPGDTLTARVQGEYGARDSGQLVGTVSGKAGPLAASLGAGHFRTDGFSAFNVDRGGAEKDGFRNSSANATLTVTLSDAISADLRGWYSRSRIDFDGFAPPFFAFGDTRDAGKTRELIGYAGLNAAFLDGRLRNRLAYAITDTDRLTRDEAANFVTFDSLGRNERFEYQGGFDLSDKIALTYGAETETARFRISSFGGPATRARAGIDSLYGQITAKPLAGMVLNAGIRHDDHETFGGETSLSASAVYAFATTEVRASYGEGFKAPSLYQLLGDYGNQSLQPERAKSWDIGVVHRLLEDRLELAATWFHRTTTDQIGFGACTGAPAFCATRPFGAYFNIARARANGLELSLLARPTDALLLTVNYSYIDTQNRSPGANFGKDLPRRPRHSATAALDYVWPFGLSTGITLTHAGRTYDDAGNFARNAGYALVDLRASFPLSDKVELYGRIENLLNEHYEVVQLYGTPRRGAFAGVRAKL